MGDEIGRARTAQDRPERKGKERRRAKIDRFVFRMNLNTLVIEKTKPPRVRVSVVDSECLHRTLSNAVLLAL